MCGAQIDFTAIADIVVAVCKAIFTSDAVFVARIDVGTGGF